MIPERLIRVKPNESQLIQRKCDITNLFAKIPLSKITEKKTEMTKVPPLKKIKKEKGVNKKREGKTEEKKNKDEDHSTKKLEGYATCCCKFDKE